MLMRFDPFRELDRLSDEAFGSKARPSVMPLDAFRQGERFFVAVDLPGVDPASVDVTVEKNVLTIKAERHFNPVEGQEWAVSERPQGTFTRQLFLGDTLDTDAITARYQDGVLTLEIPIAEKAKPRRVAVSTQASNGEAKSVEAKSVDTSAA